MQKPYSMLESLRFFHSISTVTFTFYVAFEPADTKHIENMHIMIGT